VIISKTFTIRLDHFLVSDVVATKRVWGPLRKLHRFPQMNTDTWMFKITKKRLTECMVSVTEPTGDLRVRVDVVAAARWVTIGVAVCKWPETMLKKQIAYALQKVLWKCSRENLLSVSTTVSGGLVH
jgi:hypothetical protein